MIDQIKSKDILFIDIETVPQCNEYSELSEEIKKYWEQKSARLCKDNETPEDVYERAGIWAEFGKIVCISAGFIFEHDGKSIFRVRSFYNDNEYDLLNEFKKLLLSFFSKKKRARLCAHNGKEFDFPYLARRMIINNIPLPAMLNVAGLKPWDVPFLDTMELWKFGDYKHYTSLALLTTILGLPNPKNEMDGASVSQTYYTDNDIEKIVSYCENDTLAVARIFLRFKGEQGIDEIQNA